MMALDRYRATVWPVLQMEDRVQFTCDNNLAGGLLHMQSNKELCDITLHLQGRDFQAHRIVLAATSEYFRMMFTSNMKEKNSTRIDLTESIILSNVGVFDSVLVFLYTGLIEVHSHDVEDLIRTADFLLLTKLKDFCQEFYLKYLNLNLNNCLRVGAIAERHHLQQVSVVARNLMCSRFHDHIAFGEELLEIPQPMLADILKDAMLTKFMSPDDLVRCICHWIQHEQGRVKAKPNLLHCIDLHKLRTETIETLLIDSEVCGDASLLKKLQELYKRLRSAAPGISVPALRPRRCRSHIGCKVISSSRDNGNSQPNSSDMITGKSEAALLCINTNPFLKYIKILMYRVTQKKWYAVTKNVNSIIQNIPGTQTIGATTLQDQKLYLFVSYFIPFPQNFQSPMVLEHDLVTGEERQLVFQYNHASGVMVTGCETPLVDLKSLPPVFICRNNTLYIVANVNAMGCLYVCDITTQRFACYQISNTRFISKARAAILGDDLYIWCRHRFGNEDVHFHASVSFGVFNMNTYTYSELQAPPGISYYEFENPHVMCVQDSSVVVHTPGKDSHKWDTTSLRWQPEPFCLPGFPRHRETPEMGYHGHLMYVNCGRHSYLVQNPAIYTTSLCCLTPGQPIATCLCPPPLDGIGVMSSGTVPAEVFSQLQECTQFDQSFTEAIMNPDNHPNGDSEDSGGDNSERGSEEQDGYLFDDEIYGFNDA